VGHILVVDDHPDVAQSLALIATTEGCDAAVATDGHQAVKLLRAANSFDLVILDYHMPVMSGLDVLRSLMASPPARYVPIVMYSADVSCRAAAVVLGAVSCLSKGADDFDRLIQLIHDHCD
jgi:two-component system sensor histidine kinase RpfC